MYDPARWNCTRVARARGLSTNFQSRMCVGLCVGKTRAWHALLPKFLAHTCLARMPLAKFGVHVPNLFVNHVINVYTIIWFILGFIQNKIILYRISFILF